MAAKRLSEPDCPTGPGRPGGQPRCRPCCASSGRRPEGCSLVELVRESGLTRPTVHRLLASLAAEGLLDHDPRSGNWVLGPEILLLGSVASARFPLEDIARPSLRRLAEETGESAFFSIRRGARDRVPAPGGGQLPGPVLCAARGRPVSAGRGLRRHRDHGLPARRRAGSSCSPDWAAHAGNFAAAHTETAGPGEPRQTTPAGRIFGEPGAGARRQLGDGRGGLRPAGRPAWALSLTGIEPRFRETGARSWGGLLMDEAHRISTLLQG